MFELVKGKKIACNFFYYLFYYYYFEHAIHIKN